MAAAKKTTLHLCAKDFYGEGEAKATLAQEVKKLKLLRLVDQRVTPPIGMQKECNQPPNPSETSGLEVPFEDRPRRKYRDQEDLVEELSCFGNQPRSPGTR